MSQRPPDPVSGDPSAITAQQERVLALLSAGSTLSAAAASAGVHRNTIAYWRRTSVSFRHSLARAIAEKALYWREQAEQLAAPAIEALRTIVTNAATPPGVRLKAALAILEKIAGPAEPDAPPDFHDLPAAAPAPPHLDPNPESPRPQMVHKNAQSHVRPIDARR